MKLKILKAFDSYKVDDIVSVNDEDGVPLDLFWRKRLRDRDAEPHVEVKAKQKSEDKE